MGIGNSTGGSRHPGATIPRSLPLMGIGNGRGLLFSFGYDTSLPLMGIGNTPFAAKVASTPSVSLPLMGIGNYKSLVIKTGVMGLITPHGDRKLFRLTRAITGHRSLITPHGDRKLERDDEAHAPAALITPHGDRKLEIRRLRDGGTMSVRDSLPLMGIGNGHRPRAARGGPGLITPHGDRKLERRARTDRRDLHSLPLMGIGNPPPASPASPPRPPHYPSWGSETRASAGTTGPKPTSLPLMGIGNMLAATHSGQPPASSLPLMGIGNFLLDKRLSPVYHLITPHGDRKPSPSSASPTAPCASLPLMGIGNPLCISKLSPSAHRSDRPVSGSRPPNLRLASRSRRVLQPGACRLAVRRRTNRDHAIGPFPVALARPQHPCSAE